VAARAAKSRAAVEGPPVIFVPGVARIARPVDVRGLRMKGVDPVQFQVGERPDFLHRRGIAFRQRSAVLEILSILGMRDEYLVELEEVVDDVAVGLAVERGADAVELDEHEDQGCYGDADRGRTDNQTCKLDWLLSTRGSQPAKEAGRRRLAVSAATGRCFVGGHFDRSRSERLARAQDVNSYNTPYNCSRR